MATLTEAALFSKKSFNYLIIALAALLALFILIRIASSLKDKLFPPSPIPATVAFDKLPKPDLTEGIKPASDLIYKIETISGELPNLPLSAKVFKAETADVSFGDPERTKSKVVSIGFTNEPVEISDGRAKFIDSKNQSRQIIIETVGGNFTLINNYLSDPQLNTSHPTSQDAAVQMVHGFFGIFGLDASQFPSEKAEVINYTLSGKSLKEAESFASVNLMRIILNRADLDKIPVINANSENPRVWAMVSDREVLEAKLSILPLKIHKFAIYPLKGVDKAFQEIKGGKAFLNRELDDKIFPIREVTLGYVETEKFQQYLQPFYLFKGENGQIVYIGAVDETWIKQVN